MPNYRIEACEEKDFAPYAFRVASGKKQTVEGKLTFNHLRGRRPEGRPVRRGRRPELRERPEEDRRHGSGVGPAEVADRLSPRRRKGGLGRSRKGNGKIWLRIVEKGEMAQHVVADAASFGDDIRATGHVAVYGIYFDTARSALKPESTPRCRKWRNSSWPIRR